MPKSCDDRHGFFSMEHALDSRFVGLVGCHHNEARDAIGDLDSLVCMVHEPVVCDQSAFQMVH